jgi:hypothetical protein
LSSTSTSWTDSSGSRNTVTFTRSDGEIIVLETDRLVMGMAVAAPVGASDWALAGAEMANTIKAA